MGQVLHGSATTTEAIRRAIGQAPRPLESIFYADSAVMRPDDAAIDHVGGSLLAHHLGQSFEHGVEHPRLDPAPIAVEDAGPLAIFVGQVAPLRAGARHPHHALEEGAVVTRWSAAAPALRGLQRADQFPFFTRKTDPFAQSCLQKAALNQSRVFPSSFVHET